MRRRTRVRVPRTISIGVFAALALLCVGGVASAPAHAQTDPLDALRAEVPEGNPGEFDLTEANEEFMRLVNLYGQTTLVADFGEGSRLTGPCGGWAYSYDEDGALLDAAMDAGDGSPPIDILGGEQAFTASNPFMVDTRGVVVYYGFSPLVGDGPMNHSWFIKTSGISLDKGGDPNSAGNNRNTGLVDLANDLPLKFSAKVKVEGEMTSDNLPTCVGQGHVDFQGNGLLDPVGIAGLALLGGGLFGLLFNARPAMTYKVGG